MIVVTGKGRASSWMDEPGVLRRLAPHWLRAPDLRAVVLGFEEAARHGGAGALYVRLQAGAEVGRRNSTNGMARDAVAARHFAEMFVDLPNPRHALEAEE